MKIIIRKTIPVIVLLSLAHCAFSQHYTNYFTEQLGPINWKALSDSVAPNVPEYLFSHQEENKEYKEVVVGWIYEHPDEFDAAKMIDARLHGYVHWAVQAEGANKGDGPYGNPTFVYYPVNENRPVFIDTHNTDQDSLVYNHKTQNWYFQYHKDQYEEHYGELPKILPYPKPIMHPNEFSKEYGISNYEWYYPEFSTDQGILKQYYELYEKQYGKTDKVNHK